METFIKEVSEQEGWAFVSAVDRFLGASVRGFPCKQLNISLAACLQQLYHFL